MFLCLNEIKTAVIKRKSMESKRLTSHSHLIARPLIPFWFSGPGILVLLFAICHSNQFSRFLGSLANTRFSTLQPSLLSTQHFHTSYLSIHLSGCYFFAQKLSVPPYQPPPHTHHPRLASPLPLSGPILSCSLPSIPFILARLVYLPFLLRIPHATHPFSIWKSFPCCKAQ